MEKSSRAFITRALVEYIKGTFKIDDVYLRNLFSKAASSDQVASVLWSLFNICRSSNCFGDGAMSRLYDITVMIIREFPEKISFFPVFLEQADFERIGLKNVQASTPIWVKFDSFNSLKENPGGFSHLLFALFKSSPNDILSVCGRHMIDPNVLLYMTFDSINIIGIRKTVQICKLFPDEYVIMYIMNILKTRVSVSFLKVFEHYVESEGFSDTRMWSIFSKNVESFNKIIEYYMKTVQSFSVELSKPITKLTGENIEDCYSNSFKEARRGYNAAKSIMNGFIYFRLLLRIEDDKLFRKCIISLAKFDPCQNKEIALRVKRMIIDSLNSGIPDYELILLLSCHDDDNFFFYRISQCQDLPPYMYSSYLLPYLTLSDVGWQLSNEVFRNMQKMSIDERITIYQNFQAVQDSTPDLALMKAASMRKIRYLFKRLSSDSAERFSYKLSLLAIKAPTISAESFLQFIMTNGFNSKTLSRAMSCMSFYSLDVLLCHFVVAIEKRVITSGPNNINVSEWPTDISQFLGKLFSSHYSKLDIEGYLNIIYRGIGKQKMCYVCLFYNLISKMSKFQYRGNLTKSDFDEIVAIDIRSLSRLVKTDNDLAVSSKVEFLKRALGNDRIGLKIIQRLDSLREILPSSRHNDLGILEILDHIQYSIIGGIEAIDLSQMVETAQDLYNQGFSLTCAFHLARFSDINDFNSGIALSPQEMNNNLFSFFWACRIGDFHLLTNYYEGKKKEWESLKIEESRKMMVLMKLEQISQKNIEKVNEIRKKMEDESVNWFTQPHDYIHFIQYCIIPRCLFSQIDSAYSSIFIKNLMHFCRNINENELINAFLKSLHYVVCGATPEECLSFGIFLKKFMHIIHNRDEEKCFHEGLLAKAELLFSRKEITIMKNTILMLNSVVKYFPDNQNDAAKVLEFINNLGISENENTMLKRYKSMLQAKMNGHKTEENAPKIEMTKRMIKSPSVPLPIPPEFQ